MALIKCIECGKEISDKANACPYCGCPAEYQRYNSEKDSASVKVGEAVRDDGLWDNVIALIDGGQKLEAIKKVREATGVAVSSCRAILNRIEETKTVPQNIWETIDLLKQAEGPQAMYHQCLKCGAKYPNCLHKCPICETPFTSGYSADRSKSISALCDSETFKKLVQEARENPNLAVKCTSCQTPFPSRLLNCPGCGRQNSKSNTKPLLTNAENNSIFGTINCPACGKQISTQAESCPHCGQPTGVHVCPKCGSTNTKVISGASKATSLFLWGPFAANKVMSKYQCKDCLYKW